MKEEKILESMFEKARKEKPKMPYKAAATGLLGSTTIGAFAGVKALLTQNIYLNSIVGVTVGAAVTTTIIATSTANSIAESNIDQKMEIEYQEHIVSLVDVPLYEDFLREENIMPFLALLKPDFESINNIDRNIKMSGLTAYNGPMSVVSDEENEEMDLNEIDAFIEDDLALDEEMVQEFDSNNMLTNVAEKSHLEKTSIESISSKKVDVEIDPNVDLEKELKYSKVKRSNQLVSFKLNNTDSDEAIKAFFENIILNGINVEMKWNYAASKDRIKKINLELSDAEGFVQKVVAIDFKTIELFWKVDHNGYPFDLNIIWDEGEVTPIDLKDEMYPIHKYKR